MLCRFYCKVMHHIVIIVSTAYGVHRCTSHTVRRIVYVCVDCMMWWVVHRACLHTHVRRHAYAHTGNVPYCNNHNVRCTSYSVWRTPCIVYVHCTYTVHRIHTYTFTHARILTCIIKCDQSYELWELVETTHTHTRTRTHILTLTHPHSHTH